MTTDAEPVAIVYATFPSLAEAERVGGALVERGLAACVNILPGMVSIYLWQAARHRETEAAMLIKTRASLVDRVIAEGAAMHPYDNPAFVVLPLTGGAEPFLDWVRAQTVNPH